MIYPRIGLAAAVLACLSAPANADPLNPLAFASLGTFQDGGFYVDTTIGRTPTMTFENGVVVSGVVSGNYAVFDFDSVTNAHGIVNGGPPSGFGGQMPTDSYGFAILSRGNLSAGFLSGTSGSFSGPPGGGLGGNSVFGGGGFYPDVFGGSGGFGGTGYGHGGDGPGGGGQGGGFGGDRGGPGIGGNGGGLIELGAVGSVSVTGTINVHGTDGQFGNGGGGGGGGGLISLHGSSVSLSGSLIAYGGNGGDSGDPNGTNGAGGGGGGGVVLIQGNGFQNTGTINVSGGLGGIDDVLSQFNGTAGQDGVVIVSVPEPSSLLLAVAGGIGLMTMVRSRSKPRSSASNLRTD